MRLFTTRALERLVEIEERAGRERLSDAQVAFLLLSIERVDDYMSALRALLDKDRKRRSKSAADDV